MRQKLLLSYNIIPQRHEEYMQFAMNILVPNLQRIGLENEWVWHTAWGDYPIRLIVFVAEEADMREAMASDTWEQMESRLKDFVSDYSRRVVPYLSGFQF